MNIDHKVIEYLQEVFSSVANSVLSVRAETHCARAGKARPLVIHLDLILILIENIYNLLIHVEMYRCEEDSSKYIKE